MIKLTITLAVFMTLCTFSYAQSEYEITFSMTSLNDTITDQIAYPIGTTFYVDQLRKVKRTIQNEYSITYFGDMELNIFPRDKSEATIKKMLKDHKLTVVYYDQLNAVPLVNNINEDSIMVVENKAEETFFSALPVNLTAYPNPAISEISINWSNVKSDNLSLEIISMSGSIVRSLSVNDNAPFTLDISDIDQGLYILVLKDAFRTLSSKKILLNTGN